MGQVGAEVEWAHVRDGVDLRTLKPSFDRIVRVAMGLFNAVDGEVTIRVSSGLWRAGRPPRPGDTAFTDRVGAAREVVWVEDLWADAALSAALRPSVVEAVRFGAGAPILLADGSDLGVLTVVDPQPKPYDARLARRLQDLADLIADDWARHQALRLQAKAEAEAAAAKATLSAAIEASPVATAMTDRQMRIIKVSPRWRADRGVTGREVEGHSIYDLFPGSRERWAPFYDRVLAGETLAGPKVEIAMPDGRRTWMRVEARPWRDLAGAVGGVLMVSVDITDVVEALECVSRSEQRLRLAMDIGELNLWEIDYARKELAGAGWEDSGFNEVAIAYERLAEDLWHGVHPKDKPAALALWERHLQTGEPFRASYRMLQKDGPHIWVQAASEAVRDEAGAVTKVVGVIRNIDKEKRAELALERARDEAEAANRAKSEFLANMSHEIRTPLNGVMGVASALGRTELAPAQREMVGLIESSAQTLEALLSDVLDLARIEAGRLEIRLEPMDVSEAVRDVGALFAPAARAKGLGFEVTIDPTALGLFEGDGARVRQILTNLVSNAVKFTGAGAIRLGVTAELRDRGAVFIFKVSDTGIGMDTESQARLFQRFQQADGSITRRYGGTGLGLAISRSLAEAMGGALDARSEPGRGSTFALTLPLRQAHAAAPADEAAHTADAGGPMGGFEVLLAEDHPTNRRVVELILGSAGVPIVSVENGAAAVDAWEAGAFDLILMDMQMPVMDGLSAIRAIRRRERQTGRGRTLIYSLTANAMPEDEAACRAAGADGHLTKPITADALLSAARDAAATALSARKLSA